MRWLVLAGGLVLSGCVTTTSQPTQPGPSRQEMVQRSSAKPTAAQVAQFRTVVSRVEPVAERYCRQTNPRKNCDFKIVVDQRDGLPPNAFQTLDRDGRPVLGFTQSILADVKNPDEIAFVLSHEAAHHIRSHIPRSQQNATAGAILLGGLASIAGAGGAAIDAATNIGASVGARSYSKEFELEADATGTVIAKRSGYNPVRGAQYFNRIPDPGDVFLGTHPPNADRIGVVKRTAAGL
ncbi:MAG: M48 family metallopeptidase [Pseudomonadota bacterium]